MKPPRRRTWKIFTAAGCAVLLMTAGLAWITRRDLSRLAAVWLLERSGVGPASLVVSSIDLAGIHARDISLFGGAVRVEALTISYDPRQLVEGIARRATIVRPRATLTITDDGLRVGDTPLRTAGSSGGFAFMESIRIDGIRIVDARITLEDPTAAGPVEATLSTDLVVAGPEITASRFVADIFRPSAGATQDLRVTAPSMTLSLSDGAGGLRFADAAVEPRGLAWTAEALDGVLSWRASRLDATITSGRLTDGGDTPIIRPVELTANASMAESRITFTVEGTARAASGKGVMRVTAVGHHDQATGQGKSSLAIEPVTFQAGRLRPQDLFPALAGLLPDVSGSAALSGAIAWTPTTLSPALVLRLSDGIMEQGGVRLTAIRSDIAISGLWPPTTRPGQVVTATVEAGGLPAMHIDLKFQLLPRQALQVDTIAMKFLDGRVSTSPFVVDPARPVVETRIALSQVEIGEFFKLIGVDGIGGSGRLDGTITLRVGSGAVDIRDGHLAATEPGIIRLDSQALPPQITDAGESMTLVLQALADFHYDVLTIDLNGAAAGDGTVAVRLEGNNPSLLDGRPFHINIRFESNFGRLVDIALRSMEAAQALLRHTTGNARR